MNLRDSIQKFRQAPVQEGFAGSGAGYVYKAILRANGDLTTAKGGLFYRLHGEGKRDWDAKEDALSPEDRKKAEKAYKLLDQALKLTADAARAVERADLHFN